MAGLEQVAAVEVRAGPLNAAALTEVLGRVAEVRAVAYLLVSDGTSERCVFFPVGGMRLTSIGARRGRSVAEVLAARPEVPPPVRADLEALRVKQQKAIDAYVARAARGDDPGADPAAGEPEPVRGADLEALVERHGLREAYLAACRAVARDELLDLVVWDGAEYELRESNPPPKIFAPEVEATKVSLGVKDLLAEVQAAVGEFARLQPKLGALSRSVARPGPGAAGRTAARGLEAAVLGAVAPDGGPVADIVVAARRAGHDAVTACRALVALVDQGAVVLDKAPPAPTPPQRVKRALSDIARIEAALALMVDELAARKRLATCYQETGDTPRAVENLRRVGEALAGRGRNDEAIGVLRQVLDLAPGAFDARERIAHLLEQLGRAPEAIAEWLALAKQFAQFNLLNRALQTLRQAVRLAPREVDHRRRLAALLEAKGDADGAGHELEAIAHIYDADGDEEGALWAYGEVARLLPDHAEAKARLAKAVRRGARWFIPVVGVAVGALVVGVAGLWVWRRHEALVAWKAARSQALDQARRGLYAPARRTLELVAAEHDVDPARLDAVRAAVDHLEDDECGAALAAAEADDKAGEVGKARPVYVTLVREHPGRPATVRAGERLDALKRLEEEAARAARQVEDLTRQNRLAEALEAGRALAARLPWTDAARALPVPLELRTAPPGATVSVGGKALESRTPCVVALPAVAPWDVLVTLDGHVPWTKVLDVARGAGVATPREVALDRAPRWRAELLGPIGFAPAPLTDGGLVVAGDDPRVVALGGDGAARWAVPLPPFAAASGRPVVVGARVVVADTSGRVRGLEGRTGVERWARAVEGEGVATVGRAAGDLVVLSYATGLLALEPGTGEERWRADLGARLVAPATLAAGDRVLVPTDAGQVVLVEGGTGAVMSRLPTGARATSSAVQGPTGCVVALEDGTLVAVWRGVVWSRRLPAPSVVAPALADNVVYVAAGTRVLAFDAREGAQRWERDLGVPLGAPFAGAGRVYVGAADGTVRALVASSGDVRWTARADGAVVAAPVVHHGSVVVVGKGLGVVSLAD